MTIQNRFALTFKIDPDKPGGLTADMKLLFRVVLLAGLVGAGCESGPAVRRIEIPRSPAAGRSAPPPARSSAPEPRLVTQPGAALVTPVNVLSAKVITYNEAGRFVLLSFPVGQMPANEQMMAIHRDGKKVGEVKITGPRRDQNIVADLVSGEAQPGDDVREP